MPLNPAGAGAFVGSFLGGGGSGGGSGLMSLAANAIAPTRSPDLNRAIKMWTTGNLATKDLGGLLWANGVFPPLDLDQLSPIRIDHHGVGRVDPSLEQPSWLWIGALRSEIRVPEVGDIITLLNRNRIDAEAAFHLMRRNGFINTDIAALMLDLQFVIPGIQDLIRFVVREAFNPEQIKALDLDAEYDQNPDFKFWAKAQGLGEVTIPDGIGGRKSFDFAKAYWNSHWQLPSPQMAFAMLHRLRSNRVHRYAVGAEIPQPITVSDVQALLKANDFAPKWRLPLAAIAYQTLSRRDLKRAFALRQIKASEYVEGLMDVGYTREDASVLVQTDVAEANQKAAATAVRQSEASIKDALYLGLLNEQEARSHLADFGLDETEVNKAVTKLYFELELARAKRAIRYVRKKYFTGLINQLEAERELTLGGVRPDGVARLVQEWNAEMFGGRKTLGFTIARKWFIQNLISQDDFIARGRNLGYTDAEVAAALLSANEDKQEKAARLLEKEEKEAERLAQKQDQLTRRAIKEQEQIKKQVLEHGTPERLVKWTVDGLIRKQDAINRLVGGGWSIGDATNLIDDALLNAQKKAQKAANAKAQKDAKGGQKKQQKPKGNGPPPSGSGGSGEGGA